MSQEVDQRAETLSPISRRAFFQGLGSSNTLRLVAIAV